MIRGIGVARIVEAVAILLCCFCATASAQRVLNLTAPVGGEKWFGASQNITWTRTGTGWTGSEHVLIEYSRDSGVNWTVENASFLASTQIYVWYLSSVQSSLFCRIRITCVEEPTATAQTPADFRVGSVNFYVNDNSTTNDKFCSIAFTKVDIAE